MRSFVLKLNKPVKISTEKQIRATVGQGHLQSASPEDDKGSDTLHQITHRPGGNN